MVKWNKYYKSKILQSIALDFLMIDHLYLNPPMCMTTLKGFHMGKIWQLLILN